MVHFPFERDQDYPVTQLLEFEAELWCTRQSDPILSNRLREPTDSEWPWIKLRHEELIPFLYCVRHGTIKSSSVFRIMPIGDILDLRICDDGIETKLQVTIADPKWGSSRRGSQHHLWVELLNTGQIVSGFGPYNRVGMGEVVGSQSMLSGEELDHAYGGGLEEALKRKSKKEGRSHTLLVFCRGYGEAMDIMRFCRLIKSARTSCPSNSFDHTWFVDRQDGFFVDA